MSDREHEQSEYERGRASAERGGDFRDNPHPIGSTKWFQFEDGRADGGATDVGPGPGLPPWA